MLKKTRAFPSLALLLALLAPLPAAAAPAGPPICAAGQPPTFAPGLQPLRDLLGETMGEPVACPQTDPRSGDLVQPTSTGLAFLRRPAGTPTFTDGAQHWARTREGLLYWTDGSADPPPSARAVTPDDLTGAERDPLDPRPLALRLEDLPAGFVRNGSQTGYCSNDELAGGDASAWAELEQYGRQTGYVVQFFRATLAPEDAERAVRFVEQTVSVYASAAGAQGYLELRRDRLPPGFSPLPFPEFGDQSFALLAEPRDEDDPYRFVQVVVRTDRAIATLLTGAPSSAPLDETVQLAAQVAARLAEPAGR